MYSRNPYRRRRFPGRMYDGMRIGARRRYSYYFPGYRVIQVSPNFGGIWVLRRIMRQWRPRRR